MSWLCHCGLVNGGTNKFCPGSLKGNSPPGTIHIQVSENSPDWIMATLAAKEVGNMGMTDREELFAKFFNHEKVLIKDMDLIMLREHREELEKIAFEAKARLTAADEDLRERKAKTNNKQWLVTDTNPDVKVSDAINVVQQRAARMSKMDKLRKQLQGAGIDEATINEMVRNLEKKATNQSLKTITFNKPSTEVSAVQVTEQKPTETKPFDPSSLTFGSK